MNDLAAPSGLAALANPSKFLALAARLLPWLSVATIILLVSGLYAAFFIAPPDYQQGETVRVMFIHVPSAWLSLAIYTMMAIAALGTLVWRHPLADVTIKAAAPLGAVFALICLVTGSLWGRPMWGTWWVWDARLTSMFVLFLMYAGIIALAQAIEEPTRAGKAVAILVLVGFVNIPIVKFSVDWWNTLHQGASVFRAGGPTLDPSILWPLLLMALALSCLFAVMQLLAMKAEIARRRARTLAILAASRPASRATIGR
ncbi:MAG: heme ABC transporter permease [Hyphomicrobiales bacterium]|nr:heme ABC transporter permease [Hyphomicrobiales bacterium]OQW82522.1 MAG: heme transporter HemC [Proteobacteria bacterium ST_bin15]